MNDGGAAKGEMKRINKMQVIRLATQYKTRHVKCRIKVVLDSFLYDCVNVASDHATQGVIQCATDH